MDMLSARGHEEWRGKTQCGVEWTCFPLSQSSSVASIAYLGFITLHNSLKKYYAILLFSTVKYLKLNRKLITRRRWYHLRTAGKLLYERLIFWLLAGICCLIWRGWLITYGACRMDFLKDFLPLVM